MSRKSRRTEIPRELQSFMDELKGLPGVKDATYLKYDKSGRCKPGTKIKNFIPERQIFIVQLYTSRSLGEVSVVLSSSDRIDQVRGQILEIGSRYSV